MDKGSSEAGDQEEGADSLANGLVQPLAPEVLVGPGVWLSIVLAHQCLGLAVGVCSLNVEDEGSDTYSSADKCLTLYNFIKTLHSITEETES